MKNDYAYCLNEYTCIHRRGCKRWICNYPSDEVKELYTENRFVEEIDESKCLPNYKDKDCENSFEFLDRFRNSDGSETKWKNKKKKTHFF